MSGKKIAGIILTILGLVGAYYYIGGYIQCKNSDVIGLYDQAMSGFASMFGMSGVCDTILQHYWPMMTASIAALVLGVFLIFKGDEQQNISNNTKSTPIKESSATALNFDGDKSLANDAYKIYLVKKYGIEKNEALGKIICEGKLFDDIDAALNFADSLYNKASSQPQHSYASNKQEMLRNEIAEKYNITYDGEKYRYKNYQYDDLEDAIVFAKADENSQDPINVAKKDLAENTHDNERIVKASLSLSNNEVDAPKSGINFFNPFFIVVYILIVIGLFWYFVPFINYASLEGKPANILFETKLLKSRIENTVGKDNVRITSDFFNVNGKVPIGPLKRDGIYLVGSGCMKPNCANKGLIFVNTQNNDVFIVLTEEVPYRFTAYGMNYNAKNKSFDMPMPPSALRWLRSNNILIQ